MRHPFLMGTAALLAVAAASAAAVPPVSSPLPSIPLVFEPSGSQGGDFAARGDGFALRLSGSGAVYSLRGGSTVRMSIAGAAGVRGEGRQLLRSTTNYLLGRQPRSWRTGVANFGRVRYRQVLPGIDVDYYGDGRRLEFDFTLAPGADASRLRLDFTGARRLRVEGGDLVVETASGELRHHRPIAYQETARGRRQVAARWVRSGDSASFRLGSYDRSLPLVIDPAVNYSTFVGGSKADAATAIAIDAEGWVYLTGTTESVDFPGASISPGKGTQRAFLAKMHPALTGVDSMAFCTIFGGDGGETPTAIKVQPNGVIYITGHTTSTDFPVTTNGVQIRSAGGSDLFLIKLGVFGDSLVYSTLLGGAGNETGGGLALNADGVAYLSGGSASKDFPVTARAIQKSLRGATDAVVARIDTTLVGTASLTFSSYLGGGGDDAAAALSLEGNDTVWIGGTTQSADFPKAGRFAQDYPGTAAGFVSRIDTSGETGPLLYSTFLGGSGGRTEVRAVAVDSAGFLGATGVTESSLFATTTLALRRNYGGGGDAFLTVINPTSTVDPVSYSTLLGGAGRDVGNALAVDRSDNFWVAGASASSAFPASTDAFQTFGGNKAFLTGINPRKVGIAGLVYSTAIGGGNTNVANAVTLDAQGNPYVAGRTNSVDFPVGPRRYQDVASYADEAFLTVFEFLPVAKPQRLITPTTPVQTGGGGGGGAVSTKPIFLAASVTNAASAVAGAVSPGEVVRIGGANLGPDSPVVGSVNEYGLLGTSLAGVVVTFDGTPAPLAAVSVNEIIAVVPYVVSGRTATVVVVENSGVQSDPVALTVAPSQPGIFVTTIANEDNTTNSSDNPAAPGTAVSFVITGEGQTAPPGVDGQIVTDPAPTPLLPVTVTLDGVPVNVLSAAGVTGSTAGYCRVTVEIPSGAASGVFTLVVDVGGATSQPGVSLSIGTAPLPGPTE